LGPITDPFYRLLIDLLADHTGTPLNLSVFRDVFLPIYDPSNHLATLVQFHQWYLTYRGYFFALPEVQQYRSPPPDQLPPSAAVLSDGTPRLEATAGDVGNVIGNRNDGHLEEPLPYRTEVDCALAHYLSTGKFSDNTRIRVTTDARTTTHPDIFMPMVNEMHFALLPAAKAFLMHASNNLSPTSRSVRIAVSVLALLLGIAVIVFCAMGNAVRWWRIIPLPWMTVALFYLLGALLKLDGMRVIFGLTERGLVEDWVVGDEKRRRRHKIVIVEDEWVKKEQGRRMRWILGLWLFGVAVMWSLSLAL